MMTEIGNKGKAEIFTYENHDDSTDCSEDPDSQQEPNFGLLFDIDGVLGRGLEVLPQAAEAFKLLCDPDKKELRVPVALVTNGSGDAATKVQMVSKWFGINIHPDQVILAPSPLSVYKEYHDKCVLFIGQGNIIKLANEGCTSCLSTVRYGRSRTSETYSIILTGEPARWESSLQLLVDLLMTDGKPDEVPETFPEEHLPIIACNMDLVYMDKAALPRFGHGAFLICLQTLYNQLTGYKLRYTSLLGKPSEITFRFAEHILTLTSKRMGYKRPIDRLFFFG
uniref:Cat eye syndrome critical region protein 5-like protein n=1 Tax=Schistosoma haematobium TaxID=6185 RepID=A0A095BWN1_SCHHA